MSPMDTNIAEMVMARRGRLGMTRGQLAEHAGLNRNTLATIEGVGARAHVIRAVTLAKVIASLDELEAEAGVAEPPAAPSDRSAQLIEFTAGEGAYRVTVKGPIENMAELEAAVVRLMEKKRQVPKGGVGELLSP